MRASDGYVDLHFCFVHQAQHHNTWRSHAVLRKRGCPEVRPDLGKKALRDHSSPNEYWFEIGRIIRELITVRNYHFVVGWAILHGGNATDGLLVEVVRRELLLHKTGGEEVPIISFDPVYAGAFGTARLGLKCISHESNAGSEVQPKF